MRVYGTARERGDMQAPTWFTGYLKKELGDDFECWWVKRKPRRVAAAGGFRWVPGAWAVFKRMDVLNRVSGLPSVGVSVLRPAYVDVMTLDGNFGTPVGLGRWVVHALKHSDITRRGNGNRLKQLDDINENDIKSEYQQKQDSVKMLMGDKLFAKLSKKIDEDRGTATMSGDDKKAMTRWERRVEKQIEAEVERNMKISRFYGT